MDLDEDYLMRMFLRSEIYATEKGYTPKSGNPSVISASATGHVFPRCFYHVSVTLFPIHINERSSSTKDRSSSLSTIHDINVRPILINKSFVPAKTTLQFSLLRHGLTGPGSYTSSGIRIH